jgi:[acyl-carrier-protein] S-malonyltransferase
MGRALADASPAARAVFDEVDAALGEPLSRLIFEGDAATLTLTENAQPALMAVSVAATRLLLERAGRPLPALASFVAGHSLGEYSALTAAGALDLADAARLLRRRGRAMQQAVPVGAGAMAALLGPDLEAAQRIAAAAAGGQVCTTANDNAPGQVVVSGHREAVERAVALAAAERVRGVMLPVSAPFHCPLMAPAAEVMAEALAAVAIRRPAVPLVANVTAAPVEEPDEIRRLLVAQVTGTVRWRESVLAMRAAGVGELVELGAGKVLGGLVRRIDPAMTGRSLQTPADIDTFLDASLNQGA